MNTIVSDDVDTITQNQIRLPDALLIGFMKAGTTFLRSYFEYHPDINWSRQGSIFLSADFDATSNCYFDHFKKNPAVSPCLIDTHEAIGLGIEYLSAEQSLSYCFQPDNSINNNEINPDVNLIAARIKRTLPNSKIIMIIRNQVDWFRSFYIHLMRLLPSGRRRFQDFLSTYYGKCALQTAHYHESIAIYQRTFGSENVHVMLLEEVKLNQQRALRRLCQFLNIDFHEFPEHHQQLNSGRTQAKVLILRHEHAAIHYLRKLPISIIATNTALRIIKLLTPHDVLSKNERAMLHSMYAVSNYRTSQLIGIDLHKYGYPL